MAIKALVDYINKQLEQGKNKELIKEELLNGGWQISSINEALVEISPDTFDSPISSETEEIIKNIDPSLLPVENKEMPQNSQITQKIENNVDKTVEKKPDSIPPRIIVRNKKTDKKVATRKQKKISKTKSPQVFEKKAKKNTKPLKDKKTNEISSPPLLHKSKKSSYVFLTIFCTLIVFTFVIAGLYIYLKA